MVNQNATRRQVDFEVPFTASIMDSPPVQTNNNVHLLVYRYLRSSHKELLQFGNRMI